jgi:ACT domain-containing protein
MIMLVEIDNMSVKLTQFQSSLDVVGQEKGLEVRVMHEDIFNAMHRI